MGSLCRILLATLVLAGTATTATAAEKRARLTINVTAQGKTLQNVDMSGGQPAAAASDDDEDYDEGTDPEPRYLSYFGYDNCGASAYVKVDRTSNGAYDDVQGLVPWSEKEHADCKGEAVQLRTNKPSGSRTVTQKMDTPGGGHRNLGTTTGTATITVTWKWEEVAN